MGLDSTKQDKIMTDKIIFTQRKLLHKKSYSSRPVFNIIQITFTTSDSNWVSRLSSSIIKVRISGLDKDNNEIKSSEEPISFAQYISTNHIQPVLSVNRYFKVNDLIKHNIDKTIKWTVTISLENINLGQNESVVLNFMDSAYVEKRIQDWKSRIKKLYKQIDEWVKEKPGFSVKVGAPTGMYEELMANFDIPAGQIETINIFNKNGITASIKPRGLWIIGANGGIDINSLTGSFIIVDHAQPFEEPRWILYPSKGNLKNVPFNKVEFLKII